MNKKVKSFIDNIGLLCETWTITYRQFRRQGLKKKEALNHTRGFMTAYISSYVLTKNVGGEK